MNIKDVFTKSIGAKLIALFLIVSIVPIIIVGVLSYNNAQKALEKSIEETIISTTVSRANHIADLLTVSLDVILSASELNIFQDNLNNVAKKIDIKQSTYLLREAMEDFSQNSNTFYRAKIMNKKGIVIASTTGIINEDGKDVSDRIYFKEGLKGHYISDPYKSTEDGIEQIVYSAPVYSSETKTLLGVLVIHQALDNEINGVGISGAGIGINAITTNIEGIGETGEIYLVNKDRLMFTPSRFKKNTFLKQKVSTNIFENTSVDEAILEPYKDYSGELAIGVAELIRGTDWVLIGEFDVNEAFAPIYKLRNRLLLISIIIAVIIAIFAFLIARYFTKPLIQLTDVARLAAIGDLSQDIEVKQQDEIGELANSFRSVQQNMREKTYQAKQISEGDLTIDVKPLSDKDAMGIAFLTMVENLRSQLGEINEGVNVLASSASEIMAAVSQLASSAAETATSVGETTTTVEEVKQTAEVSNEKATGVSENSQKTMEISQGGTKAIKDAFEGMNRIKQQMESIADIVVKLSEQSQTIGEINATVNDLAEQSNLLSVNASIEAAKAGEHGKGFAVVAQEIKNLAERSKEANTQIRGILSDIQKSVSSAVMATEEGGKTVDEGLKLSTTAGEAIEVLSESITEAAQATIQIAASSQQQLVGMDQIVTAMENIKEASMQTAASTKQSETSVTELHKLGGKLQELLKQYKIS